MLKMVMFSLIACDILGEYRRGHQDCLGKSPAGGLYSNYTLVQNHHENRGHVLKKITKNVWGMVHLVQTASKVAQIARGAYVAAPRLVGETTGLRKMVVINCSMICLSIPSTYAKC